MIGAQVAPVICGDKVWTRAGPLALVEGEFNRSCRAYVERRLTPLLETDVVGYAYHAILTRTEGAPLSGGRNGCGLRSQSVIIDVPV